MEFHVGVLLALLATLQSATSQCSTGLLQLDESVLSSNGTIAAGLLLVCRDGVWGTIQTDAASPFWAEKNALVACRSLGFNGALNTIPATQIDPEVRPGSDVPVLYRSTACTGVERLITDCPGITVLQNTFTHISDVYLVCWPGSLPYNDLHTVLPTTSKFGDVRLVGDAINGSGAVEIFTTVGWTTICPDKTWNNTDATVICQALGYETGTAQTYHVAASNRTIISPVLVGDSQCAVSRQASSIFFRIDGGYCTFAGVDASTPCTSQGYAGVICRTTSEELSIRMFGLDVISSGNFIGVVEYLLGGKWGVLCAPTSTSSVTSQIICGELGYRRDMTSFTSLSTVRIQSIESRQKPAWLLDFTCDSSDSRLRDCGVVRPVGYGRCRRSGDILVISCGPRERPLTGGQIAGIVVPILLVTVAIIWLIVVRDKWLPPLKRSKFWQFMSKCSRCQQCREWKATVARKRTRRRAVRQQRRAERQAAREAAANTSQPMTSVILEPHPAAAAAQIIDSSPAGSELFKSVPPPYDGATEFPVLSTEAPPPYSIHTHYS